MPLDDAAAIFIRRAELWHKNHTAVEQRQCPMGIDLQSVRHRETCYGRAGFSIVCEPQSFSDPAQGNWIHRGFHAAGTTLCLYNERHDFLAAVWIANCLERRLPVKCWKSAESRLSPE